MLCAISISLKDVVLWCEHCKNAIAVLTGSHFASLNLFCVPWSAKQKTNFINGVSDGYKFKGTIWSASPGP